MRQKGTKMLSSHDKWLTDDLFAAIVRKEHLQPVGGKDGVFFPPTFATEEKGKSRYQIDHFSGGGNVCLVDSIGSQANRIEVIFLKEPFSKLVPNITVKTKTNDETELEKNIIEASHRAGDAVLKCTSLYPKIKSAFVNISRGNHVEIAKISPTSLVYGTWDSRGTQEKLPRVIASTIYAFDVVELKRSAVFTPTWDYSTLGIEDPEPGNTHSDIGFSNALSTNYPGGVIAKGEIRRDVVCHLAAIRFLQGSNEEETLKLRRYILGLTLVSFSATQQTYLRQGCNLVGDPTKPNTTILVKADGSSDEIKIDQNQAFEYANAAANDFGVGESETVYFDKKLAEEYINSRKEKKDQKAKKAKKSEK